MAEAQKTTKEKETRAPTNGNWRVLLLLALAELLAMATWFSASAVVPALTEV